MKHTLKFLILTLGFLKDEDVHDDIRDLLANDHEGNIRATAARTLAKYIDVNDIPLLKEALKDTARVKNTSDVFYEGRPEFRYPVRQEAAVPLRKMGFKVTPESSGNYTVGEK